MSDVEEVEVQEEQPVVVGKRVSLRPLLVPVRVKNRFSHTDFLRTLRILRSLGKMR